MQTLPESDFPDLAAGDLPHKFSLTTADLKRLVDKTQFAISTEETRYYLNGIYLHAVDEKPAKLRAVATDGHRLAQVEIPLPKGASGMPGVIVPRKTVAEVQKLVEDGAEEVGIELSPAKIRFTLGKVTLTSKLIDGTFPDYGRVIPAGNDKTLIVERADFAAAVDRVSTVSSERGRAVKLSLASGKLTLSVTNPDSGSATEELEVDYSSEPLDIGFNSRYLLDITSQIEGEKAELKLADPGSPTLLRDQDSSRRALCPDADAGVSARKKKPAPIEPQPAPRPDTAYAARIHRLQLTNFRSYRRAELNAGPGPIVLLGANGAGKTNILEAISFLAPGRGLRRATLEDAASSDGDGAWAVSALIDGAHGEVQLGTGIDVAGEDESPTRRSRIEREKCFFCLRFRRAPSCHLARSRNGRSVPRSRRRAPPFSRSSGARDRHRPRRARFGVRACAALAQPAARRRRERRALARCGRSTRSRELAVALAAARAECVERLRGEIEAAHDPTSAFSRRRSFARRLDGSGGAERRPRSRSRIAIARILRETRERDRAAGRTLDGPHRTDLVLIHREKNIPAARASTGERKALLVGIVVSPCAAGRGDAWARAGDAARRRFGFSRCRAPRCVVRAPRALWRASLHDRGRRGIVRGAGALGGALFRHPRQA